VNLLAVGLRVRGDRSRFPPSRPDDRHLDVGFDRLERDERFGCADQSVVESTSAPQIVINGSA
jgi:hypothetical protein